MKIQRIRYCVNCRELLPLKCHKCIVHPERKPKPIEIYDLPPILATGPCGCVKVQCEIPAQWKPLSCKGFSWRTVYQAKTVKSRFCSRECSLIYIAKTKDSHKIVPCKSCKKPVKRYNCEIKSYKETFCSQACRKIGYFMEREKKAKQKDDLKLQMLYCQKHADVTEHRQYVGDQYECVEKLSNGYPCMNKRSGKVDFGDRGHGKVYYGAKAVHMQKVQA